MILPEVMIEDIKELFRKGYTRDAAVKFVKREARRYVDSDKKLMKCISSIEKKIRDKPKEKIEFPKPPEIRKFDPKPYKRRLSKINEKTALEDLDQVGIKVAKNILKKNEKFKKVKDAPELAGTPFDFLAIRNKKPYIIKSKSGVDQFTYPEEVQKMRIRALLRNVKGLRVALLQLKLKEAEYRIFYDHQLDLILYGSTMPLGPIEQWIRDRV